MMVRVPTSSAVDCGFESRSVPSKDYDICIFCLFAIYSILRSKSKDWLVRNQDIESEWDYMSTHGLFSRPNDWDTNDLNESCRGFVIVNMHL